MPVIKIAVVDSPEVATANAIAVEVARGYGLPTLRGAGETDSKDLDVQMGFEKACSFLGGMGKSHVLFGAGEMDSANNYYPPCLVMDDEILSMVKRVRALGQAREDLEEVADLIREVGPGGGFLDKPHTFHHCRDFWQPDLFVRNLYGFWREEGRESIGQRVARRAREIQEADAGPGVSQGGARGHEGCV
ncbi:MAG: trimethylamine methyltransferase family protein [Bacillota bacterium]